MSVQLSEHRIFQLKVKQGMNKKKKHYSAKVTGFNLTISCLKCGSHNVTIGVVNESMGYSLGIYCKNCNNTEAFNKDITYDMIGGCELCQENKAAFLKATPCHVYNLCQDCTPKAKGKLLEN